MRIRLESKKSEDIKKEHKEVIKKILTTQVKGIPNIMGGGVEGVDQDIILPNGDVITKNNPDHKNYKYKQDKTTVNPLSQQYIIFTEGSNLLDTLTLPYINFSKTFTNDIHETLNVLGIEATREIIIREIIDVLQSQINRRHVGLLADVMTAQGYLVSVDRYGVNKTDTGILSRATFEETTKMIANASVFGEIDTIKGVSSNIMFGQFFPGGTNAAKILLDEEMLLDPNTKLYSQEDKRRKLRKIEINPDQTLAECQNLDFDFKL